MSKKIPWTKLFFVYLGVVGLLSFSGKKDLATILIAPLFLGVLGWGIGMVVIFPVYYIVCKEVLDIDFSEKIGYAIVYGSTAVGGILPLLAYLK